MGTGYSWEDLAEPSVAPSDSARTERDSKKPLLPAGGSAADVAASMGAGPELVSLLRLREGLERSLRGVASGEDTRDQRDQRRFPVKVHTKETRIEERRLRQRDEDLARLNSQEIERAALERSAAEAELVQKKRVLERQVLERARASSEEEVRRRNLEHAVLLAQQAGRVEAEREIQRREIVGALCLTRKVDERQQQRAADRDRRERERRRLLDRWEQEHRRAHARSREAQEREALEAQRADDLRRRAIAAKSYASRKADLELEQQTNERREQERLRGAIKARKSRTQEREFHRSRDESRRRYTRVSEENG